MNKSNIKFQTQHRMRPEICDLLVGTIYEELRNHQTVYDHPKIKGVQKSMFFLGHREPEQTVRDVY